MCRLKVSPKATVAVTIGVLNRGRIYFMLFCSRNERHGAVGWLADCRVSSAVFQIFFRLNHGMNFEILKSSFTLNCLWMQGRQNLVQPPPMSLLPVTSLL